MRLYYSTLPGHRRAGAVLSTMDVTRDSRLAHTGCKFVGNWQFLRAIQHACSPLAFLLVLWSTQWSTNASLSS